MASVEFTKQMLRITYEVEDGVLEVMGHEIGGEIVSAIPDGVAVRTDTSSGQMIELSVHEGTVNVSVDMTERRKLWDGDVGLRPYMEAYRQAVSEREHAGISEFQDDGDYILLHFFLELPAYADVPHRRYFSIAEIIDQVVEVLDALATRAEKLARAKVAAGA